MARLQSVAENLWVAQFPLSLFGIQVGRQMAVVRLPSDGSLTLISPGPPEDDVTHELARIGPVRHIVAPSCFHDTFIPEVLRAYPGAALHASPGFERVLKTDRPARDLTGGGTPEAWRGVLDCALVAGMPKVNEVLFCHRPSRTLIVADFVFNIPLDADWWTRLFFKAAGEVGRPAPTRIFKSFIRDRTAFDSSLQRIFAWDFDRLIPSHGRVLVNGASEALRRAWGR